LLIKWPAGSKLGNHFEALRRWRACVQIIETTTTNSTFKHPKEAPDGICAFRAAQPSQHLGFPGDATYGTRDTAQKTLGLQIRGVKCHHSKKYS